MADSATASSFDPSRIGFPVESEEHLVDAARTIAYARAIEDDNPGHLSGSIAPPVFAVVPVMTAMVRTLRAVAPAGFAVHGEHDLVIHRPIRPGMRLRATATATGMWPTSAGVVVVTRIATRAEDGEAVNDQRWINLVPKAALPAGAGERPPTVRMPAGMTGLPPDAQSEYALAPDLGRRYAEASGDHSPYTFDDAAARALGLPGAIVGGICTMSYASRAIVERFCAGRSEALRRLALRFSRLLALRPDQHLSVPMWRDRQGDGRRIFFEMRDGEGTTIVTNGLGEVAA